MTIHRDHPFNHYLMQMRNDFETEKLRLAIREELLKDTARARRACRFADLVQYLVADFLPHDRDCRRIINERLAEAAFAGNCEIINVPVECDELDRIALERRMLETKMAPLTMETKR